MEEGYHECADLCLAACDSHAVGAYESHVALGGVYYALDCFLSFLACFTEATCDYDSSFNSLFNHVLECARYKPGWYNDDCGVDVAWDIFYRWVYR